MLNEGIVRSATTARPPPGQPRGARLPSRSSRAASRRRLLEHDWKGVNLRGRKLAGYVSRQGRRIDSWVTARWHHRLQVEPGARRQALQLPIYGVMAQQHLEGYRGRSWTVKSAGYVAFKEKEAFVSLGGRSATLDSALADGQARLIAAVDGIERGEFPVKPDEPYRCQWCGYASVCRKDYVGDE